MNNNLIDNRQIRVFISSTFRDMQDERDYLMKRTFPKLRKLAAERDVTLTELDLRWGITEEESKSGKVVEICLREIENSIPFFIGIIGNRYGWVPAKEDLSGNVTERFTDVNKYIDQHLSVTEMEMQFGVLSREEDMHAYFYIKEQEESAENIDYPEMLSRLKEEVRRSKYPSTTYNSPENLAMQVEEAFIALLDQLFPQTNLSELEKERIGQRSFMNQLCQNYIKDDKNFAALDAWLTDENRRQYVVTGASGLGKSALIANWVKDKLNDSDRKYNIIYHFTGNGGSESNSEHITKSLIDEINNLYGWEDSGADTKLSDLFVRVSAEDKPLLIVIDAINQIVDTDNAKLLNWLPAPTKNIKILFTTLEDDRTMEVFKNRDYPIFTLQPLDVDRRSLLVKNYLKLYAKTLTEKQVERIVTDSQCENTLVLKTLLDELINFGIYEKLDERIEYYLKADTIDDFYQALLESYEEDYKEYDEDFVKKTLSLIAASKNGLTEDEILSIAEVDKPIYWSSFYCSFDKMFCLKNGRISFSHTYIREAVEKRYYLNEPNCSYRYNIANYFASHYNWIAISERLYQLYKIRTEESSRILYNNLNNPVNTSIVYVADEYFCRKYWVYLRSLGYTFDYFVQSTEDLTQFRDYSENYKFILGLRSLLYSFGEYTILLLLEKDYVKKLESDPNVPTIALIRAYNDIAELHTRMMNEATSQEACDSNYNSAIEYYSKSIELSKKHSESELAVAYNGAAVLCSYRKMYEDAIKLANKALEINLNKYGRLHNEIAVNYNTLANAYSNLNDFTKAIEYNKRSVDIVKTIYGASSNKLITAYYNSSCIFLSAGHFNEAMVAVDYALNLINDLYANGYSYIDSYLKLKKEIESKL